MARCPANVVDTTLPDLVVLCRNMRPDEWEQVQAFFPDMSPDQVAAMLMLKSGVKFTLLDASGAPVAAGGYESVGDGIMRSWMVGTTAGWVTHWRSMTKATNWLIASLLESGVRRLETNVLASRTDARNWYTRSLRMHCEGVLRKHTKAGQDLALYSRLAGD